MPLKGNLDTFRLEEILQLIASQRKDGVLRLTSGDRHATLVFGDGRILGAHEPGCREQSSLEVSLARLQVLEPAALGRIAETRATDGSDPVDIILHAGLLPAEDFTALVEEHLQDLLLRALSWRSGGYEFLAHPPRKSSQGFHLAFRTEGILMESMRRQDEMVRFRKVLSSPSLMLTRCDVSLANEPDYRRRRILEALVTPRTLGELEEQLPLWLFDLYDGLHGLWEASAVEVQGAEEFRAQERMRRKLARSPVEQGVYALVLSATLVALALAARAGLGSLLRAAHPDTPSIVEEARVAQYCDDLRLAAEVGRIRSGSYPVSLARVPGWATRPAGAPDPSSPGAVRRILSGE